MFGLRWLAIVRSKHTKILDHKHLDQFLRQKLHSELHQRRNGRVVAVLPDSRQVLLVFHLSVLREVPNLVQSEVVKWHLNLDQFLSKVRRWVLHDKHELLRLGKRRLKLLSVEVEQFVVGKELFCCDTVHLS